MLPKDFTPDVIEDPNDPRPTETPPEVPLVPRPEPPDTPFQAHPEPSPGETPPAKAPAAPPEPKA
jgi:hypothetical protein